MAKDPRVLTVASKSVNQELIEASIRHAAYLERLKVGEVRRMMAFLERNVLRPMFAEVSHRLENIAMRGGEFTYTNQRLVALFQTTQNILREGMRGAYRMNRDSLFELAEFEGRFQAEMFDRIWPRSSGLVIDFAVPNLQILRQVVTQRPMDGLALRGWWNNLGAAATSQVNKEIASGLVASESAPQIVRRLRGIAPNYSSGVAERIRRDAESIVRTAVTHTSTQARERTYEENSNVTKGVQWVSTLDRRTCPVCGARDGQVYPVGEGPRPPAHPRCLPGDTIVAAGSQIAATTERWFEGDLVIIRTAAGHELSVTPNHPILGPDGWIPANEINVGFHVFGGELVGPGPSSGVYVENENGPSSIHEISEAFGRDPRVFTAEVPIAAPDFHGDGRDGDVCIVRADRELLDRIESSSIQGLREFVLELAGVGVGVGLSTQGDGALEGVGLSDPPGCVVCGLDLGIPLLGGHSTPFDSLLLGSGAHRHAVGFQDPKDDAAIAAEAFRQSEHAITGSVKPDEVISVEVRPFSGHVFNLETFDGWYLANGIVSKNCRCGMTPVTKHYRAIGPGADPNATRVHDPRSAAEKKAQKSIDGSPPATMTYNQWLRSQPADVQDDILGPRRGRLYRSGKEQISDFQAHGKPLSIKEIQAKERRNLDK